MRTVTVPSTYPRPPALTTSSVAMVLMAPAALARSMASRQNSSMVARPLISSVFSASSRASSV